MEVNFLTLLGIGLAAMFFGYFFGLFEGRGQGYRKRKKEEPPEQEAQSDVPQPMPAAAPTTEPAKAPELDDSVLRLIRCENSQFRLDLDGQSVDASALAPAQRRRLIDLMLIMRPWVEGAASRASGGEPRLAEEAPPPAPPSVPRAPAAPAQAKSIAIAAAAGPAVAANAAVATTPVTPEMSLVAQIDAVLQIRLAGTPLADTGLRLIESPEGGVIVMVGLKRYPSVDAVPDPQAQAAIRAAIAEWEAKYAPR